jgi:hypothetical protein
MTKKPMHRQANKKIGRCTDGQLNRLKDAEKLIKPSLAFLRTRVMKKKWQ